MSLSRRLLTLSLAITLPGVAATAWALPQPQQKAPPPAQKAQKHTAPDRQRQAQRRQHSDADQRALNEAVRRAERNGQVLSAEQVQYDGRDVNRVKIVDDRGRVRVYWDDPAAGGKDQDGHGNGRKRSQDGDRTRDNDDGDPTL